MALQLVLLLAGSSAAAAYGLRGPAYAMPSQLRVRALRCAEASPFEDGANAKPAAAAAHAAATLEFTVDNVDKTLDEVRPYLISDGGNVKVVSVDTASFGVELQLQGACGSCPSCKYFYACLEEALRTLRCDSPRPGTLLSRVAS
jgi:Fe-S cluster biogenesis protein NfuA